MLTLPADVGPKLLILSTSGSPGAETALAGAVSRELAASNADVTRVSLADYPLPLMAPGTPSGPDLPASAKRLAGLVARYDGILLLCGERNASLPAAVKNMIDWISLAPGEAWSGPTLVLATFTGDKASQTAVGEHLRTILTAAGVTEISGTFVFRDSELGGGDAADKSDAPVSIRIRAMSDMLMRVSPRYLPA